jgi:hypothetical protein
MVWHLVWDQEQRRFDSGHPDHAAEAQVGERAPGTGEVVGSIPICSSMPLPWDTGAGFLNRQRQFDSGRGL